MISKVKRYFLEIKSFTQPIDLNLPENHKIILDNKKETDFISLFLCLQFYKT